MTVGRAQAVYSRGDEYSDTFPLWDWKVLPAVTTELDGNTECAEVSTDQPSNKSCWVD